MKTTTYDKALVLLNRHWSIAYDAALNGESRTEDRAAVEKEFSELFTHPPAQPDAEASGFERMFMDACSDLGLINESLDLDPEDGGAEPILDAIEVLRARIAELEAQLAAHAGQEPSSDDVADIVSKMMNRAWSLGQTYWQQADSEYTSQHRKSNETQAKFHALIDEMRALILAAPPAPANPIAIVQAAMEAAAKWHDECERSYAHPNLIDAVIHRHSAKSIRAIDKQTILDGMSK